MSDLSERLHARARACRLVSIKTDFYALPPIAQEALYGIASELDDAEAALEAAEEALRRITWLYADNYITVRGALAAAHNIARAALASAGAQQERPTPVESLLDADDFAVIAEEQRADVGAQQEPPPPLSADARVGGGGP